MGKYAAGELKPPSTGMCFLQVEFFFFMFAGCAS